MATNRPATTATAPSAAAAAAAEAVADDTEAQLLRVLLLLLLLKNALVRVKKSADVSSRASDAARRDARATTAPRG